MKAEMDLYCPGCGAKIYTKGDEMMSLFFNRSEECCSNCNTTLRTRRPGGQGNPYEGFVDGPFPLCRCHHLHGCEWMIYDIEMRERCHYQSSGETAK